MNTYDCQTTHESELIFLRNVRLAWKGRSTMLNCPHIRLTAIISLRTQPMTKHSVCNVPFITLVSISQIHTTCTFNSSLVHTDIIGHVYPHYQLKRTGTVCFDIFMDQSSHLSLLVLYVESVEDKTRKLL